MNNNFEQQWDQLSLKCRMVTCPKTDEEMDRIISSVVSKKAKQNQVKNRRPWYWSIAAACIAGLVVLIVSPFGKDKPPVVKVNGSDVYFLSNSNCSAENTIDMFNSLID